MLDKYKRLASVPVGELRGYKFHLDNLTRIKKLRGHEVIGRVAHALGLREVRLAVRANNRGVGAGHINAVLLAGAAHAGLGENADDIQGLALMLRKRFRVVHRVNNELTGLRIGGLDRGLARGSVEVGVGVDGCKLVGLSHG